jgi:hypothetical protein
MSTSSKREKVDLGALQARHEELRARQAELREFKDALSYTSFTAADARLTEEIDILYWRIRKGLAEAALHDPALMLTPEEVETGITMLRRIADRLQATDRGAWPDGQPWTADMLRAVAQDLEEGFR